MMAALALSATIGAAAEYAPPVIRLPLMTAAPTIDGKIADDEWAGADRMERFGRPQPLAQHGASFWVGGDEKELFIAVRSETPPGGKLLAAVQPLPGSGDALTYTDDSIEVYFTAKPEAAPADQSYYQGIFNSNGAMLDQYVVGKTSRPWRGKWRVANSVAGTWWTCEIAIPWADLDVRGPLAGQTLGLRVARNWQRSTDMEQTEWSPMGGAFRTPDTMPRVSFDAAAPVVQVVQLQDAPNEPVNIQLALRNPAAQPLKVHTLVDMQPANSALTHSEEEVALAAGEIRRLSVRGPALAGETIATHILVTSVDKATTFYRRDFSWKIDRASKQWELPSDDDQAFKTQFAYFPSVNAVHARIDLTKYAGRAGVTGAELAVRKRGTTAVVARTAMPAFKDNIAELPRWDIPVLPAGDYEMVAALRGAAADTVTVPFVRRKFAWQNNSFGKSDVVLPPFTPIGLKGNTVNTIHRSHAVNGLGLWDQVTADGAPLLRKPMRIEAKIGGKVVTATGKVRFGEKSPTTALSNARWSAGPLRAQTQSRWDMDGAMRATLTLQPTTEPIDSLTLVIPLDDAKAPLMHVCTDGVRINYAGKVAAGTGRVWDGSQARHIGIIGNYVPYLWVGGPERGLAVFGENDRGWITDGTTPCQELVRNADGTLELRLNLVQKTEKWTAPRQISFGLQATPVKPMSPGWRLETAGNRGTTRVPGQHHSVYLGAGYYYGTLTATDDLYPRNEDFHLWDVFRKTRETGKIDFAEMRAWLDGYKVPDTPGWQRAKSTFKVHVESGFYQMASKPDGVIVYTNPRGVRTDTPDGEAYLDEWVREAFPQRKWPFGGSVTYNVDTVESFRDYSAFYWHKMLTSFVDGIYWDDCFLVPNYDPIVSQAYVRQDGQTQSSSGIWNFRALVKRGATLVQELGKPNKNMLHMTNTAMVPILSYGHSQLSWEYAYGVRDFQDRFSRDYLQAESIGRQAGVVPFALTMIDGSDKAQKDWAARTCAGVLLTHEIKPIPSATNVPDFWKNYDRLVQFGYGTPEVTVSNYWEASYPVKTSGETSSLLLRKGKQLLLVVCDWGEGGEVTVELDAKALGLGGALKAHNVETAASLATEGATVKVPLKKHDFAVISVESGE